MPSEAEIEAYHSKIERCRSEKVRLCSLNPIQSNPIRIQSESESNPNTNSVPVHTHGSQNNVRLTEEEMARLSQEYPDLVDEAIEFLSLWLVDKGDKSKAKTHNATIRRWVIDAVREKRAKKGAAQPSRAGRWDKYDTAGTDEAAKDDRH